MTTVSTPRAVDELSAPGPPVPGRRVLVVDGEPMILRLLTTQLSPHGFAVTTTDSVLRAAGECRHRSFNLILIDIDQQASAPLLERSAPRVPIAFLSADVHRELRVERLGGTGVLLPKFQPTPTAVRRLAELCDADVRMDPVPADVLAGELPAHDQLSESSSGRDPPLPRRGVLVLRTPPRTTGS